MRILILQAGFNEIGIIIALKGMGHYVLAIGNQKGLIGQKYVDEYYCVDYSDTEKVLEFVQQHNIDRICACCNDTAVLTACYVAERMNLCNYEKYETAQIICHKDLFKKYAVPNDIMTIPSISFGEKERDEALEFIKQQKYPIIVKPVDLSGGKGVSKCNDVEEAKRAVDEAFDYSKGKKIVIEHFVEGRQHGFCTFLVNRKVVACCSNDEISLVNPYRVEIDMFPASDELMHKDILINQVEIMAQDLHLSDGIFHVQYIEDGNSIYILEAMRRIIGNMYSIPAKEVSGFDWDYYEALANIGEIPVIEQKYCDSKGYYAYRAIIPNRNGRVMNVQIDERLEKYIFNSIMLWKKGQVVTNYKGETLGILFLKFSSAAEMRYVMLECSEWVNIILS